MSFNRYYQSELSALRELGLQFAERNPALAPFLGQGGRDPDVERLLEGFAFLTGRLREKLDDELPELAHSLVHLLWPHYMRPLPACAMLQFDPLKRTGPALSVARHTAVEARELDGVSCRFRTAFDTEVQPLALTALRYGPRGEGASLVLRLGLTVDGHLGELHLARLRLHLCGERYLSQALYLALLRQVTRIGVVLLDRHDQALQDPQGRELDPLALDPQSLQPLGFADDQALIPAAENSLPGYRHLQEYFAFPDKFLFVELSGLDALRRLPDALLKRASGLELRLELARNHLQHLNPSLDNVRLHCVPVVNLFKHDAQPIRLDGRQDQYRVLPAGHSPQHCGVYAVDQVQGWRPGGQGYRQYVPFESFLHDEPAPQAPPFYAVRQQLGLLDDELQTYLRFAPVPADGQETLSIELTCTNQNLPRRLALGDICQPCEGMPEALTFRNIGVATPNYPPPLRHDFLWQLIRHLSLNYLSLRDIQTLRTLLATYDLPRYHDPQAARTSRRRLDALRQIRQQPVDRLLRGLPVRGIRSELTLDTDGFLGEGELFLFASVLNEFFALYSSVNAYHELHVISSQGESYRWTPRLGQRPLL